MTASNRRVFLKHTAAAGLLAALGLRVEDVQAAMKVAQAPRQRTLSKVSFELLTAAVDVILPRTSTPSGSDVRVHEFVDFMLGQWLSAAERREFERGLNDLNQQARDAHQISFMALDSQQKTQILAELDHHAFTQSSATPSSAVSTKPFALLLKQLALVGYFTAEPIAQSVLEYDPIPVSYNGSNRYGDGVKVSYKHSADEDLGKI